MLDASVNRVRSRVVLRAMFALLIVTMSVLPVRRTNAADLCAGLRATMQELVQERTDEQSALHDPSCSGSAKAGCIKTIADLGRQISALQKQLDNNDCPAPSNPIPDTPNSCCGWSVDRQPRTTADVDGDGKADVVAFGDDGVWTAVSNGAGGFAKPALALQNFGGHQGWSVAKDVRLLGDVDGDKRPDIVGFGDAGVWLAHADSTGGFARAEFAVQNFGAGQGWDSSKHVRALADINGDGKADIVAFGDAGVWTSLSTGAGFAAPAFVLAELGFAQGWRVGTHERLVADVDGDGRADLVAFGNDGVWLSLADGSGGFGPARFVLQNFGVNQGWTSAKHVRFVADVNGDGKADIVAFGDDGVWTALSNGTGFAAPTFVLADLGFNQGWRVGTHERLLADVNGDGKPDIVAFGNDGVWLALANGTGGFAPARFLLQNFGVSQGWTSAKHVRLVADVDGDHKADIVAFGDDGVWTARSNGSGFAAPAFVLADFAYGGQMDVVQSGDGTDDNGFARNPHWRAFLPNACGVCPCGNDATNPQGWKATPGCTIASLSSNTFVGCEASGIFGESPALDGLMSWSPVEYEGKLEWGGHSNSVYDDDDYFLSITRPDGALETLGRSGVHFEFDSEETVDNWDDTNTWWNGFHHNAVDDSDAAAHTQVDGKQAIVVGMVALDLAHDDHHSELHPAYAVFVRVPGATPNQEKIAFFVRNWGNQGFCGRDQVTIPQDTIRVRVRHPIGSHVSFVQNVWTYGDDEHEFTQQSWNYRTVTDGLLLTFSLRDAAKKCGFVGDLDVDWGAPAIPSSGPLPEAPQLGADEVEVGDPALKAKFDKLDPSSRKLLFRTLKGSVVHVRPRPVRGTSGGPPPIQIGGIPGTSLSSVVNGASVVDPVRQAKKDDQHRLVSSFLESHGIK